MEVDTVVLALPTYNNEDTVGETLSLMAEQTRRPDRIVICDNSNDETRRVAREQAEKLGLTLEIIEQKGDGVSDAYDQILEYVSDEYDVFVTLQTNLSVNNDWLETHLQLHQEYSEIGLITGSPKSGIDVNGEVNPDDSTYYIGRNFSTKVGVLEKIDGWDVNFLRGEDWDMRIRLGGAGVRAYHTDSISHEWQYAPDDDPYVTITKAKRKPTSISFLDKYGFWYLRFHPSHVVADGLSLAALVSLVGVLTLPIVPMVGLYSLTMLSFAVVTYWFAHVVLRGGVDGNYVTGPIRKQLLNGVAVVYASRRVLGKDQDWNMCGFDPSSIPRYKF